MFTRHADAIVRQYGVVLLKKKQTTEKQPKSSQSQGSIFPRKLLTVLRQAATIIQNAVIVKLDQAGKVWNSARVVAAATTTTKSPEQPHPHPHPSPPEEDYSFSFAEVASRCLGRLDIRYGMNQPPFTSPQVLNNPWIWPTITSLLGDNAQLVYCGLVLSFPGSSNQPWHQDGQALFPELLQFQEEDDEEDDSAGAGTHSNGLDLPPYALNVFVPLTPIESALGPTEFWVGSHKESHWKKIQHVLIEHVTQEQEQLLQIGRHDDEEIQANFPLLEELPCFGGDSDNDNDDDDDGDDDNNNNNNNNNTKHNKENKQDHQEQPTTGIVAPTLNKGDVLIYDYRTCHRGTSNVSATAVRPMLYLMYARPWFAEHVNFGKEQLFAKDPPLPLPTMGSGPTSNKTTPPSGGGGTSTATATKKSPSKKRKLPPANLQKSSSKRKS